MSEFEPAPATPEVSDRLVSAREKLGLSQQDVADQLYLSLNFIRCIDEAEFQRLSKPAFIKGYLRSYARVVDLDGDDLVARYDASLETEPQVYIRDVTEERVGSAALTGPVVQTGLIALVAIIVVVSLVWYLSSGDEDEPEVSPPRDMGSTHTEESDVIAPPADHEALAVAIGELPAEQTARTDVGGLSKEADTEDENEDVAEAVVEAEYDLRVTDDVATSLALKQIAVERTAGEEYQYITIDAGGFEQLEFSFTDECWLEIEDGEGDSIYGDLNRGSDVLTVYGVAPFKILLGRASAVTLRFNGEEVDLTSYTSNDLTAKVSLGG